MVAQEGPQLDVNVQVLLNESRMGDFGEETSSGLQVDHLGRRWQVLGESVSSNFARRSEIAQYALYNNMIAL